MRTHSGDLVRRLVRVWTDPRLLLWTIVEIVAAPVVLITKLRRHLARRSKSDFDPRRWFIEPTGGTTECSGPHIVLVGASFGEVLLTEMVAEALEARISGARVTLCVRDQATISHVRKHYSQRPVAIWPLDFIVPVSRWLRIYRPDVLIFTERFRFTVLSCAAKRFGARVALINGRSRRRDSALNRLFTPFYRWTFGAFDTMCFQQAKHAEAARPFTTRTDVRVTGDLKIDLRRKELPSERAASLEQWLSQRGSRPLLGAGSTDSLVEEQMVLEAFKEVRTQQDCRLLLAPRRVDRRADVLDLVASMGLTATTRSGNAADADVYLLDTMGELAHAYKYCESAYVGGAYRGMGHNVLEPVEWGVQVAYGMNRGHFETLQKLCETAGVGTRVKGSQDLAAHWLEVLADPSQREPVAQRCSQMLEQHRGARERTVDALLDMIDRRTGRDSIAITAAESRAAS